MPVETASDREVFLNGSEFGATLTWRLAGGTSIPDVACLFDRPHENVGTAFSMGDAVGAGFGSSSPSVICADSDIPADAAEDDTLTVVDGYGITLGDFVVRALEPDGTGMTIVRLEVAE